MKQLSLNEMEVVNGGITCDNAAGTIEYLRLYQPLQWFSVMDMSFIGCYDNGEYVNFWDVYGY